MSIPATTATSSFGDLVVNLCTLDPLLNPVRDRLSIFWTAHPLVYKVAVFVSHLFRMGMILSLPYGTSLIGSLFYAIAIEKLCSLRFTIPSCWGGLAYQAASPGLAALANGAALASLSALGEAMVGVIPLTLWVLTVAYLSHRQVNGLPVSRPAERAPEPVFIEPIEVKVETPQCGSSGSSCHCK